jgi:hypothetical protein
MSYDLADAGADYPEWHGPPCRTLVICTQQRSGSTLTGVWADRRFTINCWIHRVDSAAVETPAIDRSPIER